VPAPSNLVGAPNRLGAPALRGGTVGGLVAVQLSWLRTFATVYRLGSFTRAAQALELSQPAVTQQVRNLEKELGRPLFERTPQGVQPTSLAEGLILEVRGPISDLDRVLERNFGRPHVSKPLHVGGPAEFITNWVVPAVGDLIAEGLWLRFGFGLADELLARLSDGEFDLVLSTIRPRLRGITATALVDEEFALVASKETAARIPPGKLAEEGPGLLDHFPLIAYGESLPIVRRYWRDVFESVSGRAPSVVVPDLRGVLAAVKSSGGVSVLPTYLCAEDLASGEIVALLEPEIPPINTLYLATRSGGLAEAELAAFHEHLLVKARMWN
jgi:DNA-binding transcriptional LysR family regulator